MPIEPVTGQPVRFPPGRVAVRLTPEHRSAYRRLYAHYATVTDGLPPLRDRDFDGRRVLVTPDQLEALNRGFAELQSAEPPSSVFAAQEAQKTRLFKRLQFLS